MIKSLFIQNFQSHKDSTLDFHPGVNIIVGTSNSGKTAIIRALKKLTTNRPGGEAFRSNWGGDTKIELTLDTDTITYVKGKENEYRLNDTVFRAFGTDVPEEIRTALNMNEINLQQQLVQPFLLTSTPGEVAQHFNKIAHLDNINTSLKLIQSWLRKIKGDITYKTEDVKTETAQLQKYEFLDKAEAQVEVLEGMNDKYIRKINNRRQLKDITENINTVEQDIPQYEQLVTAETLVDDILQYYKAKKEQQIQKSKLSDLIAEIARIEATIETYKEAIKAEPFADQLLSLYAQQKEKTKERQSLQELIRQVQRTEALIVVQTTLITNMDKEWHEMMPAVCPICETKLK